MTSTPHVAEEILSKGYPSKIASDLFTDKILHKPLHLRPTSPDPASQDARARRRQQRLRKEHKVGRKKKVKPLSAKEKRIIGVHDIPRAARQYDLYVPLHQMWLEYMRGILAIKPNRSAYVTAQSSGSVLASADFHGALMRVVKARCASLVGIQGIVLKDTKFTFQVITPQNAIKIVPKRHTVFGFSISESSTLGAGDVLMDDTSEMLSKPLEFELYGSQFEKRPADRSTMKFKQKKIED